MPRKLCLSVDGEIMNDLHCIAQAERRELREQAAYMLETAIAEYYESVSERIPRKIHNRVGEVLAGSHTDAIVA